MEGGLTGPESHLGSHSHDEEITMKTASAAVVLLLIALGSAGCNRTATLTSPEQHAPSFNGGGFGSGTRSDTTPSPATVGTAESGTTTAGDSTRNERGGGGFGSGT